MSTFGDYKLCEHIKDDNTRCGSPALRGRHFCYAHNRVHNRTQIPANHSCRAVPLIKSERDVRVAATTILRDLRDHRITFAEARLMTWALKIANDTLKIPAPLDELHHSLKLHNVTQLLNFPDLGI